MRGPRRIPIELEKRGRIQVYAGARVARALEETTEDMNVYQGVRLAQILEAVYEQGRKDGARAALEAVDAHVTAVKREIPHRNPGKPRKSGAA